MKSSWNIILCALGVLIIVMFATASNTFSAFHCNCDDDTVVERIAWWQRSGDFMIAVAYFSIPLELIYFLTCAQVFPFRFIIIQFGLFIVLCGMTHLVSIWTYTHNTAGIITVQTVFKVLTALVSCYTATSLVRIIPELLRVKIREQHLIHKTEELHQEIDNIKAKDAVGQHVRMLTHEIRSTLDRNTILNITLFKLPRCLGLKNCTIWMPNLDSNALELTDELDRRPVKEAITVPLTDPTVQSVLNSSQPRLMQPDCLLARASNHRGISGMLAAVRLPMLPITNFTHGTPELVSTSYGILVLLLPREWRRQELDMVVALADQIAVALSHAAVLESSLIIRDRLREQNKALHRAKYEAATAIRARNEFLAVMNHHFRTPMHDMLALATLLEDSKLSRRNKLLVDIISRSSSLLPTVVNDVIDFAQAENANPNIELQNFELPTVLKQAVNALHQGLESKGLGLKFEIGNVPTSVIGDAKRLFQIALNLMGIVVKFTNSGHVSVLLSIENTGSARSVGDGYAYVRTDIKGSGLVIPERLASCFSQSSEGSDISLARNLDDRGLEVAMCKRLVQLMQGYLMFSNNPLETPTITFVVKLQLQSTSADRNYRREMPPKIDLTGLNVLFVDDGSTNCMVTRKLLDKLGCRVFCADSGHQALVRLSSPGVAFDLLVLDISMPRTDGFEVAARIQQMFRMEDRPVIVALTASGDKSTLEQCIQIGMDDVIAKPVSLNDLQVALSRLLQKQGQGKAR